MKSIREKAYILILETYFDNVVVAYDRPEAAKAIFKQARQDWEQGEPMQEVTPLTVMKEFRPVFIKEARDSNYFFSARAALTTAEQKVTEIYKKYEAEEENSHAAI